MHGRDALYPIKPLRGRGGRVEPRQVSPPDLRHVLGCKADEEHRPRRSRRRVERHARLLEQTVALVVVARSARGDDVLPDGGAASRSRDDVVEREPVSGRAAIDALPTVAREQHAARDPPGDTSGNADVRHEPNHVRPSKLRARRAEGSIVALEDLSLALPDEHVRTAKRADVQGLVARVEDEDALHRARSVAPVLSAPATIGTKHRCVISSHWCITSSMATVGIVGASGRRAGDGRA
jgi:hypothetical protein